MVKYKTVKNLSDLRTFMTIRPDDQEWVAKDWNPRAIKALGKIKSAVILPPNMIQKQALENVSSKNQKELSVTGTFGTVEEAIAWLRK